MGVRGSATGLDSVGTISAIADLVHESLDFRTVAERATDAVMTYTPFTCVSIYSLDEQAQTLHLEASKGFREDLVRQGRRLPVEGSLIGLALTRQEVVITGELSRETRGMASLREALVRQGFHRAICVPLIHRSQALGSMNLVLSGKHELSGLELATLLSIGKTIAMALANARHVDRIEREVAERRMAEQRYALATSAARVGVWDWNLATGEFYLDANVKALLGYSDAEIPNDLEVWKRYIHPEDDPLVAEAIGSHLEGRTAEFTCEHRMLHKDGSTRWIMARGSVIRDGDGKPLRMIGTDADITERKRLELERRELEAQILHAEKLKSLGVLAGGIAHDFNNLLTSMLGNADLALEKTEAASPARPFIEQIETAARRAAELTHQILSYSGQGVFVPQPVDLSALVKETAELLGLSISKKAVLQYELGPDVPNVEGDPSQLRQVIMNLITNASEALGDGTGTIIVRTGASEPGTLRDPGDRPTGEASGRGSVYLEVSDTGCGMDPSMVTRIFDPFFTTKFTGRGLGLAAVQGIVHGHGGEIEVHSVPRRGTRIRVRLPAAEVSRPSAVERPREEPAELGGGTVLVVDDEPYVRDLAANVLSQAGFTVLTAEDGQEAVQLFSGRSREIRLVLLDLTMPRLGGREAARAMREIDSEARVILTSGYTRSETDRDGGEAEAMDFLEKPYTAAELVDVVRRALGR